jgi:hypothetical protein
MSENEQSFAFENPQLGRATRRRKVAVMKIVNFTLASNVMFRKVKFAHYRNSLHKQILLLLLLSLLTSHFLFHSIVSHRPHLRMNIAREKERSKEKEAYLERREKIHSFV